MASYKRVRTAVKTAALATVTHLGGWLLGGVLVWAIASAAWASPSNASKFDPKDALQSAVDEDLASDGDEEVRDPQGGMVCTSASGHNADRLHEEALEKLQKKLRHGSIRIVGATRNPRPGQPTRRVGLVVNVGSVSPVSFFKTTQGKKDVTLFACAALLSKGAN